MTYFRTCSSRRTRSQAPLCHYTRRLVSNQAEGTFARLRYSLGGDRPSQTTHLTLSTTRIHGVVLGTYQAESGISLMTPPDPKARFRRLPPMLRTT